MTEWWQISVVFASGAAIAAAVISLGDKFMAWYMWSIIQKKEEEIRRLQEDLQVLQEWRDEK